MSLYHFSVTQIKRSAGSSAVASAAYRARERLHSDRYDEVNDYTKKGGVLFTDIILAPQAPAEYADRQTLWNAVESAEKRADAQLAYSFDFALQNEFTMEENMELARRFITENFVARGMTVDYAVHDPDREPGGIQNPHVHVMAPIRPINPDGTWGNKQMKVELTDENGERIWDEKHSRYKFQAVPTTDWGSPETLEQWRQNWCQLVNAKFEEKGLPDRLDWRSYERQGVDLLAQVHEGPAVRAMEKRGIRTEKGDYNHWVRATNALLRSIREKLAELVSWIKEAKTELQKPQAPSLRQILLDYMNIQKEGAKSFSKYGRQKASVTTLKDVTDAFVFLEAKGIDTPEQLESALSSLTEQYHSLSASMKMKSARMKVLKEAIDQVKVYQENLPVYQEMAKPKYKFKKALTAYKDQHEGQLKLLHRARRIMKEAGMPEHFDPAVMTAWKKELAQLEHEYEAEYAQLKPVREEQQHFSHIKYCVDRVINAGSQPEHEQVKAKKHETVI